MGYTFFYHDIHEEQPHRAPESGSEPESELPYSITSLSKSKKDCENAVGEPMSLLDVFKYQKPY